MAPEAPNQKRKRGRPSIASKNKGSASRRVSGESIGTNDEESQLSQQTVPGNGDDTMGKDAVRKKRGRPRKSLESAREEDTSIAEETQEQSQTTRTAENPKPRKRGRPSKSRDNRDNEDTESNAPAEIRPQKRQRVSPSTGTTTKQNEEELAPKATKLKKAPAEVTNGSKRSRDEAQDEESPESAVRRSKRDRPPGTEAPNYSDKLNAGRASLREVSITETQNRASPVGSNPGQKKRGRGRPSLDSNTETTLSKAASPKPRVGGDQTNPAAEENKGRKPRRKSDEAPQTSAAKEKNAKTAGAKTKKSPTRPAPSSKQKSGPRASNADEPTDLSPPTTNITIPLPRYRHLASRTRQIPRSTIASKWTPLDGPSIAAVDTIISEAYRPVLLRLRDRDHRHQQAQDVLHSFARRLHSKLVKKMPFPPPSIPAATRGGRGAAGSSGHEMELDFEKTMNAIRGLEATLDPLLHSVALLKREKEREEAALERDYKTLKGLKSSARAEADMWREKAKRMHVLVPRTKEGRGTTEVVDNGEEEELVGGESRYIQVEGVGLVKRRVPGKGMDGGLFKDLPEDDELTAIAHRLGSHMKSMQSNLKQIDGVLPAITKSKASLQGVLHRYLDPKQFDQVVFG